MCRMRIQCVPSLHLACFISITINFLKLREEDALVLYKRKDCFIIPLVELMGTPLESRVPGHVV